ncbi:hypothetical protein FOZ62_006098 [Perkinsus olseni]|uniref:Uncharacterized protein n=1 Tax=Perkinsus olseni TaxID=32597 RepID=A0A7J6SS66_PEROL|nr:hypothetical protein FOZ62_006098 [Perkinsus olseni]
MSHPLTVLVFLFSLSTTLAEATGGTECFLEEDQIVTRAFTYGVASDTFTEDCAVSKASKGICFVSLCFLSHLPGYHGFNSYSINGGSRMVDGDRERQFVKVDKVTKKAVVSQAKERGLKYTSDSPSAALKVSKKGDLTWLGANGSFEKAK